MLEEIKAIKRTEKEFRKFGLTVAIVLLLTGGLLFWKENPAHQYFLIIGVILISTGFLVPIILKPLYLVWMTVATIIGWVMARVILTILYYLMFTPIGFISRLFGKQHLLELKWDKSQETYWIHRKYQTSNADRYEKQF